MLDISQRSPIARRRRSPSNQLPSCPINRPYPQGDRRYNQWYNRPSSADCTADHTKVTLVGMALYKTSGGYSRCIFIREVIILCLEVSFTMSNLPLAIEGSKRLFIDFYDFVSLYNQEAPGGLTGQIYLHSPLFLPSPFRFGQSESRELRRVYLTSFTPIIPL